MVQLKLWIAATASALIGRRFETDGMTAVGGVLAAALLSLALALTGINWLFAGETRYFTEYGVSFVVAAAAIAMVVLGLVADRRQWVAEVSVAIFAFAVVFGLVPAAYFAIARVVAVIDTGAGAALEAAESLADTAMTVLLSFVVVQAVLRSFETYRARHVLLRAATAAVALWLSGFLLQPYWPFQSDTPESGKGTSVWTLVRGEGWNAEAGAGYRSGEPDPIWRQVTVLNDALGRLAARDPDRPNLFILGIGGMTQGVFGREVRAGTAILADRFGGAGHTLLLANETDQDAAMPQAILPLIGAAIDGIAARMDRERDVLAIFMTSHGATEGVALADYTFLRPIDLKAALDRAGIRNRIVIVSACHSGVFLPALADDNTVVIAAAAADRVSFGCNDRNAWTYFGAALFDRGLREKRTLVDAFAAARNLIWWWELPGFNRSHPQMAVGKAIAAAFPDIVGDPAALTVEPAASVPSASGAPDASEPATGAPKA